MFVFVALDELRARSRRMQENVGKENTVVMAAAAAFGLRDGWRVGWVDAG